MGEVKPNSLTFKFLGNNLDASQEQTLHEKQGLDHKHLRKKW